MQIDKNLYKEINDYCQLNSLKTRDFIHKILKDAFLKEKYSDFPFITKTNKIKDETKIENYVPLQNIKNDNVYEIKNVMENKEDIKYICDDVVHDEVEIFEIKDNIITTEKEDEIKENIERTKPNKKRKLK